MRKSDLDIRVEQNTLRIASSKSVDYGDKAAMHRRERSAGRFDPRRHALRWFVLCSIQGCSGIKAICLCIKVFSGTKPRIPDHRASSTFRLLPMPCGQLA